MTAKRDSEGKPEQIRPKLEKEKLRDLDLEHEAAEGVKGGAVKYSAYCQFAGGSAVPGAGCGS